MLVQLSKRDSGVTVDIYDGKISDQLRQDVARHNAQYPDVTLHAYNKAHDRFLIIDEEVYHIGHSLKDLGKKLFRFLQNGCHDRFRTVVQTPNGHTLNVRRQSSKESRFPASYRGKV